MSRRIKEEFYCDKSGGGCGKYFLTWLRENMFGNYSIECPACKHIHFRFIRNGLVTSDRHDLRAGEAEIIVGLKSTLRNEPWHTDPDFRRSCLFAVEGGLL